MVFSLTTKIKSVPDISVSQSLALQEPDLFSARQLLDVILYDFLVTVKVAPHECIIRTGQPYT